MDAILDRLEAAGMAEVYTDEGDKQAMRLTPDDERVTRTARWLARTATTR